MAILNNSNAISSGGYDINNSVRLRSSASAYLNRTPASAGNRKTWTWSGWVKRGSLGSTLTLFSTINGSGTYTEIRLINDVIGIQSNSIAAPNEWLTNAVFRDPSAWYHIVVTLDTTAATAADRIKVWVNSNTQTFSQTPTVTLNSDLYINAAVSHSLGRRDTGSLYFDGYLAEVNFIDGSAKTPSDFGETDTTTGVWKPKAYTGTYGTNGFYLKFSDIATTSGSNAGLGKDFSGNTNYWTTNNISVTSGTTYDAMTDVPTNTSATTANYCVLNPLDRNATGVAISSANLKNTTSSLNVGVRGTMAVSSGKWYWETTITNSAITPQVGIATRSWALDYVGSSNGVGYLANAIKYVNGVGTSYGATFTTGDIIGVALDLDGGSITFYKNNTSQGVAATGLSGEYFPAVAGQNGDVTDTNFGQRLFQYTPPTGFVALNTFNLPTPTILQGNKYMDATLYTGNGASRTVTNTAEFKTDLVWVKSRSNGATWHILADSVRGAGYQLSSNRTEAEIYDAQGVGFASNGFTLGADTIDAYYGWNLNGATYVGWQWQAGQGSTSSNTSGSITSTVSVNATAGFSVVTWTATNGNATIGHGLGVAPKMIIIKDRAAVANWTVYHASIGNTAGLVLNDTSASNTNANFWNNTTPTSTVFSVGSFSNYLTDAHVAYCWAAIPGYSAFTSYTGNGSADGPFIFLGFRPKFIMIKRTDSTGDWYAIDSSRATYNQIGPGLNPNTSSAEFTLGSPTGGAVDFLSNGFKWRGTYIDMNASGGTYIVAAWAENPFKNSLAR